MNSPRRGRRSTQQRGKGKRGDTESPVHLTATRHLTEPASRHTCMQWQSQSPRHTARCASVACMHDAYGARARSVTIVAAGSGTLVATCRLGTGEGTRKESPFVCLHGVLCANGATTCKALWANAETGCCPCQFAFCLVDGGCGKQAMFTCDLDGLRAAPRSSSQPLRGRLVGLIADSRGLHDALLKWVVWQRTVLFGEGCVQRCRSACAPPSDAFSCPPQATICGTPPEGCCATRHVVARVALFAES